MPNQEIKNRLISIQEQIRILGVDYLKTQTPIDLSDTKIVLKPFIDIETTINKAIKKLSPDSSGLIPKRNSFKNG